MKEGWEIKRLGEITSLLGDGLHGTPKYSFEGEYYFINGNNLSDGIIELKENTKRVSSDEFRKYYKNLTDRTVLVSINGTLGNVAFFNNEKIILGKSACYFNLKENIEKNFIKYIICSPYFQDYLHKEATGATIKNISLKTMRDFELPLPPLPEQKRIVAILDKAFAAIAKAKANAAQNCKNAKEIFEGYLQKVFEEKGEGWEEKRLGDIADVIGGYSFKSTDFKTEGKYQVLRMGNVRPGIIRENESPVYIDNLDKAVLKRALLLKNDVIITQTGTKNKRDYGFTVIIENENYLLNQRISAIRFSNNYLSKFFLYFSWTNIFKNQYFANETGTVGQGNVGIGAITSALIPFTSIKIQQYIVKKLDTLFIETKKLEVIYKQKINDLEELKKSILEKAFKGEL
jgi:type I restriction enzyme, S subunit